MASNSIVLKDTTYNGVSSIEVPVSGGGSALFTDVSDTTAAAADVAQGKYFYTAAGEKTQGTASGGSANIEALNVTQNGTYTASGSVDGYSPVTVNVSGGGDDGSFKAVIERTATTPTLPSNLTSIGSYAFANCSSLALTSLPNGITSIGNYAFNNCTNLALTSLPSSLTSLSGYAFYRCSNLALTSLPSSLTSIGDYVFYECANLALESIQSGITTIGQYAFYRCTSMNLTTLPSSVRTINANAFQCCTSITSIECDGAINTLGANAFIGSSSYQMQLASASFPNTTAYSLSTVFGSTTAANACKQLAFADVGKVSSITANAFANCYKLQTLVLRKTGSICTLANVSAFLNTPMRGYNSLTGTVYVPNALISTYKTATNWKTLYDGGTLTFAAIEGSQYEL